ncbi:MAG: (2Fe-2S)-binding protein [Planctomycetota bacterium]|nr:MAG: (2Fe-2S)-binding protein [Planctomycetota bacterium]
MNLDDPICLCHHVSLRKLLSFARRVQPKHPSQMADCLGAGTGCGWCIPTLSRIAEDPDGFRLDTSPEQYAAARKEYRRSGERPSLDDTNAPSGGEPNRDSP